MKKINAGGDMYQGKNKFWCSLSMVLPIFMLGCFYLFFPSKVEAAFNASYIIPDDQFVAKDTMNDSQIQIFLEQKNSYLKNYIISTDTYIGPGNNVNVRGWNAANVIYHASQWYHINPQVILATLQKEQSLVTTSYLNQIGLDWAMGYGCPDGDGCNTNYRGFAMQVDWGSWQLAQYNFIHANDSVNHYKVTPYFTGSTVTIDGVPTYMGNGATSAFYRYTPHFHGNENFYNLYLSWFIPYGYQYVSCIVPPAILPADGTANVQLVLKNTGSMTWYNEEEYNADTVGRRPMRLAIVNEDGKNFYNNDGTWVDNIRVEMTSGSVTTGNHAVFNFSIKAPSTPGFHVLRFVPVIEGSQALLDTGMWFETTVPTYYDYGFGGSSVNSMLTVPVGQASNMRILLRNMGSTAWRNESGNNPMRLAVVNEDGKNFYNNDGTWVDNVRVKMTNDNVAYGQDGIFDFTIKAPMSPGSHILRLMPVIEGITALKDVGLWQPVVIPVFYDYGFVSSIVPPQTMAAGQTANMRIVLRNIGSTAWRNESGNNPMRLAVVNEDGKNFYNNDGTWVDNVRVKMTNDNVAYGQDGIFDFTIKAPMSPGSHILRLMPVIEGITALKDVGLWQPVTVQ